jgi:hypothetical protein
MALRFRSFSVLVPKHLSKIAVLAHIRTKKHLKATGLAAKIHQTYSVLAQCCNEAPKA